MPALTNIVIPVALVAACGDDRMDAPGLDRPDSDTLLTVDSADSKPEHPTQIIVGVTPVVAPHFAAPVKVCFRVTVSDGEGPQTKAACALGGERRALTFACGSDASVDLVAARITLQWPSGANTAFATEWDVPCLAVGFCHAALKCEANGGAELALQVDRFPAVGFADLAIDLESLEPDRAIAASIFSASVAASDGEEVFGIDHVYWRDSGINYIMPCRRTWESLTNTLRLTLHSAMDEAGDEVDARLLCGDGRSCEIAFECQENADTVVRPPVAPE